MSGSMSMISQKREKPAIPSRYISAKLASRFTGVTKEDTYSVKVMSSTGSSELE